MQILENNSTFNCEYEARELRAMYMEVMEFRIAHSQIRNILQWKLVNVKLTNIEGLQGTTHKLRFLHTSFSFNVL